MFGIYVIKYDIILKVLDISVFGYIFHFTVAMQQQSSAFSKGSRISHTRMDYLSTSADLHPPGSRMLRGHHHHHGECDPEILNQLTNNMMKKYNLDIVDKLNGLSAFDDEQSSSSRSVSSLPLVKVTGPEDDQDMTYLPTRSQSNPCSPRPSRRGFTTCLNGTQYIIGESMWHDMVNRIGFKK